MSDFEPGQIIYPWAPGHAASVDAVLLPWAESKKVHVLTRQGEAEVRCIPIVDDSGDSYELVIGEPDEAGELTVVAALRNRAAKRAWHRERKQFVATQTIPTSDLSQGLDEAFATVLRWVAEAGHTRSSA